MFLWYYGNDVFKDGEIGYWYFYYLSQQIPALEAKTILTHMESGMFAQGVNAPKMKSRLKQLQDLAVYGVNTK